MRTATNLTQSKKCEMMQFTRGICAHHGAVIAVATVEKDNHVWVNDNIVASISSYPRCDAITPEERLI
jgi:hypothetical protein